VPCRRTIEPWPSRSKNEPGSTFTYGGNRAAGIRRGFRTQTRAAQPNAAGVSARARPRPRRRRRCGLANASRRNATASNRFVAHRTQLARRTRVSFCANAMQLRECFVGTTANPRYGLGWWLPPPGTPPDLVYASGSGRPSTLSRSLARRRRRPLWKERLVQTRRVFEAPLPLNHGSSAVERFEAGAF